jgi:acyl-homoserine-lactone acylase
LKARILGIVLLLALAGTASADSRADRVTIIRDNWGIAHVYGKTDADTVFGAIYAQAEDDFNRIERNYLVNLGWLAQAEGESAIYNDLRHRLFIDVEDLQKQYAASPAWLKKLMVAWADGLNFYLERHPETHPKVIRHFEPWMALSFTEGSIGGDIEKVNLDRLEEFYGKHPKPSVLKEEVPGGSNGFAIAPALSASGHALLWINPHTSFYFRSELQMVSEEGLNSYGASTWGQFFIYQGWNPHNGWMHTSDGGDAVDEYVETVIEQPGGLYYRYGGGLRKLMVRQIAIPYLADGKLLYREFTVYASHHGPIIRADQDKWIAIKLLQEPVLALSQSYLRTKTRNYAEFYKTQEMRTDTSNNTVYADADGTIAYFHGDFIPKRDARFDFTHPVDGSDPATEWQGKTDIKDTIHLKNPKNGWLQNTNSWPFHVAGDQSPRQQDYPRYMWTRGENARDLHAVDLLSKAQGLSLDSLIALGYDSHLIAFDALLPPLFAAYDAHPSAKLAEPIEALRGWNHYGSADSVPTALAILWGKEMMKRKRIDPNQTDEQVHDQVAAAAIDTERLDALGVVIDRLTADFGSWKTPWGEINRFQRITDDIIQPVDDAKPSIPVGMAPSIWGALAAFDNAEAQHTKRIYGTKGNSFIAAIEFGPRIKAKALMTGGESGDPSSKHFGDQSEMYVKGQFRDVWFYPEDVKAHAERTYHPGE